MLELSVIKFQMTQALRLLAARAEVQVQALPTFVHVPDELSLIYGDIVLLLDRLHRNGILNEVLYLKLQELNAILDEMSNQESLWEIESLSNSREWQEVRMKARECLSLLNESEEPIDLSWLSYIGVSE